MTLRIQQIESFDGSFIWKDNPETRGKRTAAEKWAIDVFIWNYTKLETQSIPQPTPLPTHIRNGILLYLTLISYVSGVSIWHTVLEGE